MADEAHRQCVAATEVLLPGESGARPSLPFQEVSGLDMKAQVIEYRAGNSQVFSTIKMPGIEEVRQRHDEEGRLRQGQQVL